MSTQPKKPNRICVVLAHNYSHFEKSFFFSVLQMQEHFFEWCIKTKREDTLSFLTMGGYAIDSMRNNVVEQALKYEQTHILMLDTDMTFPKETIQWMIEDLEENEDHGIEAITGFYVRKAEPFTPHVYPSYNLEKGYFHIAGKFPLNDLFKVEGAGAGILMVKAEVFNRVKDRTWFLMKDNTHAVGKKEKIYGTKDKYIPDKIGEDLYFFLKARPNTLCDPRIHCLHYGQKAFGLDDFLCYNGFEKKDGEIEVTKEGLEKFSKHHQISFPNLKNRGKDTSGQSE